MQRVWQFIQIALFPGLIALGLWAIDNNYTLLLGLYIVAGAGAITWFVAELRKR